MGSTERTTPMIEITSLAAAAALAVTPFIQLDR